MANSSKPAKKRRIQPAEETVREKTDKARERDAKPAKRGPVAIVLSPVARVLRPVAKPFRWLGRHLIPRYIKNSFGELKHVTWPGRKESRQLTLAVIMFATVFGFLVAIVDFGLDKAFKKIFLKE